MQEDSRAIREIESWTFEDFEKILIENLLGGERVKAVDGEITGIWDGFAYIIYDNVGKTICKVAMGDETDTFLSLNDCIKLVDYDKNKIKDCIIVILEDCLSGKVYRYNNYGDSTWYEYGSTEGYA